MFILPFCSIFAAFAIIVLVVKLRPSGRSTKAVRQNFVYSPKRGKSSHTIGGASY